MEVAASAPGPLNDALYFPSVAASCLVPLLVSPERHRGAILVSIYETRTLRWDNMIDLC